MSKLKAYNYSSEEIDDNLKLLNLSGIYSITNIVNGKKYIGAAFVLRKRLNRHKNDLNRKKHSNSHLQRSWDKYGEANFRFELRLLCEKSELDYYEIALIKIYNSDQADYGYNLESGGGLGKIVSEETRNKISEAGKGRIFSEETRRKISLANKGRPISEEMKKRLSEMNKGKHISDEARLKQKANAKRGENHPMFGKPVSEETKEKIRKANIGKTLSEEVKEKIRIANSGENHANFGKHHSETTKTKIREAKLGRRSSEETKRKISESNIGKHFKHNMGLTKYEN